MQGAKNFDIFCCERGKVTLMQGPGVMQGLVHDQPPPQGSPRGLPPLCQIANMYSVALLTQWSPNRDFMYVCKCIYVSKYNLNWLGLTTFRIN